MKHIIVSLALGLASGACAVEESNIKEDEKGVKEQHPADSAQEPNAG